MAIAQYMLEHTNLETIWFVVSPQNPFKQKSTLLDQQHRLTMVRIATEDNPKLKASNIEFTLPVPSYTVDTLAYLKEKHPNYEFSLIMGRDNLMHFHKWKNHEQILEHHDIFVYPRPYCKESRLDDHSKVFITKAPLMDISSCL